MRKNQSELKVRIEDNCPIEFRRTGCASAKNHPEGSLRMLPLHFSVSREVCSAGPEVQ